MAPGPPKAAVTVTVSCAQNGYSADKIYGNKKASSYLFPVIFVSRNSCLHCTPKWPLRGGSGLEATSRRHLQGRVAVRRGQGHKKSADLFFAWVWEPSEASCQLGPEDDRASGTSSGFWKPSLRCPGQRTKDGGASPLTYTLAVPTPHLQPPYPSPPDDPCPHS